MLNKYVVTALFFALGLAQAWDSDILQSSPLSITLTVAGVCLLALGNLLMPRTSAGVAAVAGVTAIVVARIVSPVSLPGLFIIFPFMVMPMMLSEVVRRRREEGQN